MSFSPPVVARRRRNPILPLTAEGTDGNGSTWPQPPTLGVMTRAVAMAAPEQPSGNRRTIGLMGDAGSDYVPTVQR